MHFDCIIKARSILTSHGFREGIILVKNGVVADILPYVDYSFEDTVTDAGDDVVMPGIIDPHVHINEPGRTEWEGFDTATRAAAAGGITTLIDMPLNSAPCTTSAQHLEIKKQSAKNQLHVNCGFWGGVIPGNEKQQEEMLKNGVFGFKAFLTHSGIDDFPKSGLKELLHALEILKKYNRPLLAHCELEETFYTDDLKAYPKSYKAYLQSRPDEWEVNAVRMLIDLCREKKSKAHIVHLSSAKSLQFIRDAKTEGLPLTVETAPHYIYFNAEEIKDGHTEYKCAPPIRTAANNNELWNGLRNGLIDFIATDHSPAPPEMKEIQSGDFSKAWGGIASLQFSLPAVWTAMRKRNIALKHIIHWMCDKPAAFLNLTGKGKIEKGADADFVIWNPEEKFIVNAKMIQHKHKVTPYLNNELYGVVKQTYLKGRKVFDNGMFHELQCGEMLSAS
jgi:allantoinase